MVKLFTIFLIFLALFSAAGAYFYAKKQMPYHHVIWHVFVLAGSILHYFSVLFYVIP